MLGWLLVFCLFALFIHYYTADEKKKPEPPSEPACRGQVSAVSSNHAIEKKDNIDRLFVRVLIENKFQKDVSDPVIRIDAFGKNGELVDTFVRTIYGANLPPASSAWFRVSDDLSVDPSIVVSVKASVQRADCHGSWR
jgi:hypothetical protein